MTARPQSAQAPTEVLAAMVARVTFHNAETGFCVLRLKARGHRDLITATGHVPMISAGEFVQLSGTWINDRVHGLQFRAAFLKASPPTTLEGIERYLGSGMIRGIGPVYAKALVRTFGAEVFDIIEATPERLREVAGVGPVRAARIAAGWADQKVIREIMLFLHANGVGASRAVRIYKTYGVDAVQLISENPYRLARDIRGVGFRTADQIAAKLGIEKESMIRVRAGISFALAEAMGQGHCGLPTGQLITLTMRLLEVGPALVETALGLELSGQDVVADDLDGEHCVFLSSLYKAERLIADRLQDLAWGETRWADISVERAIPWVERRTSRVLADSQRDAVRVALLSKLLVITGGPGVGKTTLVNAILQILSARTLSVLLCAPTPGGKVMQVENDYDREVYNGDLGFVRRIDMELGDLVAEFDGREVSYSFGELDELVLGLRHDHPQEPGLRISGGDHSTDHAALHNAGSQPDLHGRDQG